MALLATAMLAGLACGDDDEPADALSPSVVASTATPPQNVAGGITLAEIAIVPAGGEGEPIPLQVEVPQTREAIQRGLMHRPPLPDSRGMLFVMRDYPSCSFWMKDTPSPLTLAFADEEGRIFDIQDMEPLSTDPYDAGPCFYVLEVAQGWFERRGAQVGDLMRFPWPAGDPPPYPIR